ncbi:response regulator [Salinarimonas rosea]|uniref:response regulator n=1 Tax=Salinarimonas rosea TaxID=552063 RepID=UPI00040EAB0B|nr:response regulator [Salinarimonas rosea]
MSAPQHILVVDDDPGIRQMLTRYLADEGFRVSAAESGAAMWSVLEADPADLVLLDLVLPQDDGLILARELRQRSDIGIIMVTGRGDLVDRVVGLEVGADDYIAKPFHLREVLARIKTVLRRLAPRAAPPDTGHGVLVRFHGFTLDSERRRLLAPSGEEVRLTGGEYALLTIFLEHAGRVLDRDRLMDLTRGRDWAAYDRTIDAQVARLRKKIEARPKEPELIKSVRGVGYVFAGRVTREPVASAR